MGETQNWRKNIETLHFTSISGSCLESELLAANFGKRRHIQIQTAYLLSVKPF